MDTRKFGFALQIIVWNDFSDTFQTDAVRNEQDKIDIFTECRSYCNSSSSETGFVDYKHATDSYKGQNAEKLEKNPNLEDLGHFKFFESSSASECNAVHMKNEDNIDIFYEDDIKSVFSEENPSKRFRFYEMCCQHSGMEIDMSKSSCRFECRYQEPLYNICEGMTRDVKGTSLRLTTVSRIFPLEFQDEDISAVEITEEQDSSTIPLRLSVPPMENEAKHTFCSKLLGNNFYIGYQLTRMAEKTIQRKICSKSFSQKDYLKVHERSHTDEKPFCCIFRSKTSTNFGDLGDHGRINRKKPFLCKICLKSFSQMGILKIHTCEKPFYCKICSKSFSHTVFTSVTSFMNFQSTHLTERF